MRQLVNEREQLLFLAHPAMQDHSFFLQPAQYPGAKSGSEDSDPAKGSKALEAIDELLQSHAADAGRSACPRQTTPCVRRPKELVQRVNFSDPARYFIMLIQYLLYISIYYVVLRSI